MEDVDDTSLALGLGCGGKPLKSQRLPPVEPSLTIGFSEEIYGSVAISKSALEATSCRPARKPSSPHSTISSFSTANYITKDEKTAGSDEDADDEETGARKKLRLTKEQSALLEDRFKARSTLTPKQKQALANQLNLRPRQVEVWFQNRRARTKLKQKEIDFEFLKRCFETLKEENLRLHKELKALKFAPPLPRPPPLYMQLPAAAAATLAMCPSCERNMAGAGTARNKAAAAGGGFTAAAKPSHLFNAITRPAAC